MTIKANPKLKERARQLRKNSTLSEVLLWNRIKRNQLGYDFTRQKAIGNYITDFYCAKYKLVIEIDGSSHDNKKEYDAEREHYLLSLGLNTLHFSDLDVKQNLEFVLLKIKTWFQEK